MRESFGGNIHEICELKTKLAILEEKLVGADKALEIAKQAIQSRDKTSNSEWSHWGIVIPIIISIIMLVLYFKK